MKELLDQYATYNGWAHQRLLEKINTLSPAQHHQEVASSFSSLYKTLFHVWRSETVWLRRFELQIATAPEDHFNGSVQEVSSAITETDRKLLTWVLEKDERTLREKLSYTNLSGEPFTQPFNTMLMHVFNHSTYHNGQLVTILRQVNAGKIPDTDFITWSRLQ